MGLFSSRFKALETLADTSVTDRKPEQLAAAQAELAAAGLIILPATDKIKTMAQLEEHISTLEKNSGAGEKLTAAESRATAAEATVKELQAEVAKLKGGVPPDGQGDTPKTGKDAERPGEEDPVSAEQKVLNDAVAGMPHFQLAKRMLGQD